MAKVCPSCELTYSDDDFFCAADGSPLRSTGGDADNLVGTVVADRYRIEAILGEGGMGRVYRARHVRVPREAAIKVLRRALIADSYAVAAFNREARNAASVGDHPNIAAVYDFGETADGLVFLAMEYVEGETLAARLEREPVLSPRRALEIVRQTAAGLRAAHELPEPVVHRDLKPDNILLKSTRDGTEWVKIVDFGIAKAAKRDTQLLTTPGLVVGTPRYMSPEQLTGGVVDIRSDIYALGLIAFQMLTGRMPFASASREEESTIQWALQRLTLQPLALAQVRPDIQWPASAQAAFDGVLATAAAERTASATEFARALGQAFGLATPSEAVGVVAEIPGPVSSAVRVAAQSTAPTAPLAASPAPASPARPAPAAAPPASVSPNAPSSARAVALVGGGLALAALAAVLWMRSGDRPSVKQAAPTAASSAMVAPNESAAGPPPRVEPAPPTTPSSQPGAGATSAGTRTAAVTTPNAVPPERPAAPSADAMGRARTALDRAKSALADPDAVSAAGNGDAILRDLRRLLPALPTRADSVEAVYYMVEANLILDRPAAACRLLTSVQAQSRNTAFEAGVDRFLSDSELGCASRR